MSQCEYIYFFFFVFRCELFSSVIGSVFFICFCFGVIVSTAGGSNVCLVFLQEKTFTMKFFCVSCTFRLRFVIGSFGDSVDNFLAACEATIDL